MDLGGLARRSGLYDVVEPWYSKKQRREWEAAGRPVPAPSAVKREVLREYAASYGIRVLVETGTYKADTVRALRHDFDSIHSIEIADVFYEAAVKRCRRQTNATIHHGDSGELLGQVVPELNQSALFWLDAHHSGGETGGEGVLPIIAELKTCLDAAAGHVVLIDDMREFGQDPRYPEVDLIEQTAKERSYDFVIADDIARLTRRAT